MKKIKIILFVVPVILFSFTRERADKKWVPLFNGQDLDHWIVKIAGYPAGQNEGHAFRVENGLLSVRYNEYDSFRSKFGGLYYDKRFSNYRLKVEYRFVGETAPGAPTWGFRDSGIQYHCQAPSSIGIKQPFPICLEYNLKGGNGKDDRPTGEVCLNGTWCDINGQRNPSFCNEPFVKRTFHGDQWVTLEIECNNGTFRHFVNGEEIISYKNPRFDPANEIAKSLIIAGDDRVTSGYISLQSNSHPIDFRKIEILEY